MGFETRKSHGTFKIQKLKFSKLCTILVVIIVKIILKAALRTECARLVKYIRVVDILVVGVLRQLALESLQVFRDFVSPSCSCASTRDVR